MSRESVWNVLGCCGLSERTIKRAVCQPNGRKKSRNPDKKTSRDTHKFSENLVEIHTHIIKSSRDSHHHSYTLIVRDYQNLVETCHMHLDELISSYTHIHIDTRTRFMYNVYIHFEIYHA